MMTLGVQLIEWLRQTQLELTFLTEQKILQNLLVFNSKVKFRIFIESYDVIRSRDEIDFLNAKDKINSDEFKSTNLLGEEIFDVIKFRKFATAPKKRS